MVMTEEKLKIPRRILIYNLKWRQSILELFFFLKKKETTLLTVHSGLSSVSFLAERLSV